MSIARTRKVCWPTVRSVYSAGASHASNGSVSSEHSNVEPPSLELKLKIASVSGDEAAGLLWIVATGGVVSAVTRQVQLAGEVSKLPARSTARTRSVWSPESSSVYWTGSGQAVKAPSSREHSKVALGSLLPRAKFAVLLSVVAGGPQAIVVSGAGRCPRPPGWLGVSGPPAP